MASTPNFVTEWRADLQRRVGQGTLAQNVGQGGIPESGWICLNLMRPFVITFGGDFAGVVNIRAANLPQNANPAAKATSRYGILASVVGADVKAFDQPVMWINIEFAQINTGLVDSVDLAAG